MEDENWKPTSKVLEFMEKMTNEWFYIFSKRILRLSLLTNSGQKDSKEN
jgi:hypothetical protein